MFKLIASVSSFSFREITYHALRNQTPLQKIKTKSQNCARKPNSVFALAQNTQARRQSFICAAHPKTLSRRLIRRATFQVQCQRHDAYAFLHRLASGRLASRWYRYKRGWALTPPFHPYPALRARRYAFCCAICRARIAPARLNLCNAEACLVQHLAL